MHGSQTFLNQSVLLRSLEKLPRGLAGFYRLLKHCTHVHDHYELPLHTTAQPRASSHAHAMRSTWSAQRMLSARPTLGRGTEIKGLEAVLTYAKSLQWGHHRHDDTIQQGYDSVNVPDEASLRHKVAEMYMDGRVVLSDRDAAELNLGPRDAAIFSPGSAMKTQRAIIAPRIGRILVRTELVRAIIQRDHVILFECKRNVHTERVGLAIHHRITSTGSVPFELRVLEGLLDRTLEYLENKGSQIRMLSRAIGDDIQSRLNASDVRRLPPLQKALTALEYDIKETQEAISEVKDSSPAGKHVLRWEALQVATNDKMLASMCLSEGQNPDHQSKSASTRDWTPDMLAASRLLLAMDRRVRSLDSEVRELESHLDSMKDVWHMQLDASRNAIISLNLHLSFASIAAMLASLPAAYFGANLRSGLEEHPTMFWHVMNGGALMGFAVFGSLVAFYQLWPNRRTQQQVADMTALHDLLLYHVDEMDEIINAARVACRVHLQDSSLTGVASCRSKRITFQEFTALIDAALGDASSRDISAAEIALLYRVLDTDSDGYVDVDELYHVRSKLFMASTNSEGDMETLRSPATHTSLN